MSHPDDHESKDFSNHTHNAKEMEKLVSPSLATQTLNQNLNRSYSAHFQISFFYVWTYISAWFTIPNNPHLFYTGPWYNPQCILCVQQTFPLWDLTCSDYMTLGDRRWQSSRLQHRARVCVCLCAKLAQLATCNHVPHLKATWNIIHALSHHRFLRASTHLT